MVGTGLFGMSESFVALEGATDNGEDIIVNDDKNTVKDASRIDADRHLSPDKEETLYAHFGMTCGSRRRDQAGTRRSIRPAPRPTRRSPCRRSDCGSVWRVVRAPRLGCASTW